MQTVNCLERPTIKEIRGWQVATETTTPDTEKQDRVQRAVLSWCAEAEAALHSNEQRAG